MRLVIIHFRQYQRQLIVVQEDYFPVLKVNYGQRFAPISLAGKYPFAQLVCHGFFAAAVLFQPSNHLIYGVLLVQSVQKARVYVCTVARPGFL